MTTPPSELNRIAVDLDEAELWTLATIVRDYAALLRQTTEGTDALVSDLSEEANIVHCYEEMTNLCRTFEAENARLKAALDKYSEDEMLLIERCAKVCEVMGFKHSECPEMSEYCADAIRALAPRKERPEECPAICPNCVTPWKCNGPHITGKQPESAEPVGKCGKRCEIDLIGNRGCDYPNCMPKPPTAADDGMVRVPVDPNEGMMMAILNRGLGDPPDPAWIKMAKSRWAYLLEAAKGAK